MADEPQVSYTVKELLAQYDERAEQRHREALRAVNTVDKKVDGLTTRVRSLEDDRKARRAISTGLSKAWVAGIAILGVLVNLPGVLYYIHGGSP